MDGATARQLVRIVADMAIFLEFTDADLLDEETSVKMLEQIAASLQDLPDAASRELAQEFRSIAPDYPDADQAKFVAELPDAFGLV